MNAEQILIQRPTKTVYKDGNKVIKLFNENYSKADILNEALNSARVEETKLLIPEILEVSKMDGKWAITQEFVEGKTLETLMKENPENIESYMEQFVDLQLEMHSKKSARLNRLKEKYIQKIQGLASIDATTKYELLTRLDGMPKHTKLCHGDFNPSNVIINEKGAYIIDWAHATQGNASADAATTYLLFALKDEEVAKLYLNTFCIKSDTARQYVEQWLPIVAAIQLDKGIEKQHNFLMNWLDVVEY